MTGEMMIRLGNSAMIQIAGLASGKFAFSFISVFKLNYWFSRCEVRQKLNC